MLGGRTTLATDRTVVLARYRPKAPDEGRRTTPYLHLTTPAMIDGPQRIALRFSTVTDEQAAGVFGPNTEDWRSARHLWDVRHAAELRERCGGGTDRPPFLHADATPRGTDELPTAEPGDGDPAARAEWATLLHQKGETQAAFAAAGIEVDLTPPQKSGWYQADPERLLGGIALNHTRLEPEVRRQTAEGVGDRFLIAAHWRTYLLLEPTDAGGLLVRAVDRDDVKGEPILAEALWRRLPDLDLMRVGGVAAEHLHPLVREALLPSLQVPQGLVGPPGPTAPAPVRVRCRGDGTRWPSGPAACCTCRTATRNNNANAPCAPSAVPSPDASPWSRRGPPEKAACPRRCARNDTNCSCAPSTVTLPACWNSWTRVSIPGCGTPAAAPCCTY
ncbi:hypothetical protein O1M54_44800 [Streptomyces diastatochromogenes]|nr:hypothetical protein [Streptomyces diastatochromogenes]